uniref:Uncharacterized protein n=1 Tax=Mycena chlorophos TaxID=658473 RepID=A0ABQ0LWE7_MYCCL|nr:predicted protein [Mycena chlorophos]
MPNIAAGQGEARPVEAAPVGPGSTSQSSVPRALSGLKLGELEDNGSLRTGSGARAGESQRGWQSMTILSGLQGHSLGPHSHAPNHRSHPTCPRQLSTLPSLLGSCAGSCGHSKRDFHAISRI